MAIFAAFLNSKNTLISNVQFVALDSRTPVDPGIGLASVEVFRVNLF